MFREEGCSGMGAVIWDSYDHVLAATSHKFPMCYGPDFVEVIAFVHAFQWEREMCFDSSKMEGVTNLHLMSTLAKGEIDDVSEWGLLVRDVWFLGFILQGCSVFSCQKRPIQLPVLWPGTHGRLNMYCIGWKKSQI